jgi:type IV pilus assembly protein PilW
MMEIKTKFNTKGITLIELLVALLIGGIIIAGIYRVIIAQSKAYVFQDQIVETQQNIRSAMEILSRDLRMTGFNGDNTPLTPYITPGTNNITIFYQQNGAVRQVSYNLLPDPVDGNLRLMRSQVPPDSPPSEAGGDPILTDVNVLNFTYGIDTDEDGMVNNWVSAGATGTSRIIAVQVLLTAKPAQVNPDLNAATPRTLQSTVTLRNLCLR